uniref:Peptidase S1 domain-containing protein n=1 Tax=Leptobrachium leishanense TaxID=445787 RepID=A0A8C5LQ03_9ANUR
MEYSILLLLISPFLLSTHAGKVQHGIIGGQEATPHSRPYMAYLKCGDVFCGGSIISPTWILTAAHCFGSVITAVLGAHNVSKHEPSQQIFEIEAYHPHHSYYRQGTVPFNDIMLLKLSGAAKFNKYVQHIRLPRKKSDVATNTPCSVAGWGHLDNQKKRNGSETLFETNINILSRKSCRITVPSLNDGMICAGDSNENKDASQGDSGGPLICKRAVEGIVSFGLESPPGIYTRVSKYIDWIEETISSYEE